MNEVLQQEQEQSTRPQPVQQERPYVSPNVDIIETGEGYVLEAEMPGVSKEGLEINLEDNELTIVGRRQVNQTTATAVYRESNPADYRRVFELDPSIDAARISAQIDQGLLTLKLPKAERVKPRRITVS
jgi:HSP20 family protein